jgi:hypothetical protein
MGQEIVERFPRFMDMLEAVRQFLALSIKYLLLIFFDKFIINWLPMEAKIIELLPAEAQDDMNMSGNSFSVSIFILLVFTAANRKSSYVKPLDFLCSTNPVVSFGLKTQGPPTTSKNRVRAAYSFFSSMCGA